MSEKEDQADVGDSTVNAEYEDDFEKDTECLTDEEEKQNPEEEKPEEREEDVEAQVPKAADSFQEGNKEMEEKLDQPSEADAKVTYSDEEHLESRGDSEQEHHESGTERERSIQESKLENEQKLDDGEDEEMKHYVLEKIEGADKELENQALVAENRERKLKFKDEAAPQAPPPEDAEVGKTDLARGDDLSVGLSAMHISGDTGQKGTSLSERAGSAVEVTDDRVLVEKGGKFELLSLSDIESQGMLLPVNVYIPDTGDPLSNSSPPTLQIKELPSSDSKEQPDSALNDTRDLEKQKTESANASMKNSTYTLTPRQKELRKQREIRNERLRREEEDKQRELEDLKRQENELVFRAWLQKKKVQIQEEKRIRRAKQLEEMRMKEVIRDPEEAYRLWLKKKHQQYAKERRIEFLRRQAEEVPFIPRREECDKAFKDWLRRKREEKQAAELAAKERARQIRLEARRARQRRSIHYT
ncbi:coiled-coil domain-containing protein 181 [Oenanthe melanoleuca]|uniref:coiled-coil domain-containing protein 181 n=1 Tax=Oenanthe melanoleuca TaxID=2939378 RepID=UPI0024C1B6B3|nr:coiled-coil domain-containing protein 181 [Oenanthe melanoleuca]XP_056357192.1 coiled-coil domain-containing protein 181 [Oenanthe melanoleuca]XP_056357201.1 coiled-coil domain-containing protein 181 [Oenanthe melanoleuca]